MDSWNTILAINGLYKLDECSYHKSRVLSIAVFFTLGLIPGRSGDFQGMTLLVAKTIAARMAMGEGLFSNVGETAFVIMWSLNVIFFIKQCVCVEGGGLDLLFSKRG